MNPQLCLKAIEKAPIIGNPSQSEPSVEQPSTAAPDVNIFIYLMQSTPTIFLIQLELA